MIPELAIFDVVWEKLAKRGHCDSAGGCEYRRVRDMWMSALGCATLARGFILQQANRTIDARTAEVLLGYGPEPDQPSVTEGGNDGKA